MKTIDKTSEMLIDMALDNIDLAREMFIADFDAALKDYREHNLTYERYIELLNIAKTRYYAVVNAAISNIKKEWKRSDEEC